MEDMKRNSDKGKSGTGTILVTILEKTSRVPISKAVISLYRVPDLQDYTSFDRDEWKATQKHRVKREQTNDEGRVAFELLGNGCYVVTHGFTPPDPQCIYVGVGCVEAVCFELERKLKSEVWYLDSSCRPINCRPARLHDIAHLRICSTGLCPENVIPPEGFVFHESDDKDGSITFVRTILKSGHQTYISTIKYQQGDPERADLPNASGNNIPPAEAFQKQDGNAEELPTIPISGNLGVSLSRTATEETLDLAFWQAILNSTEALSFNNYLRYMNMLFCGETNLNGLPQFERLRFTDHKEPEYQVLKDKRLLPFTDSDAYRVIKAATEAFVMVNCGVLATPRPFDDTRDRNYFARRSVPYPGSLDTVLGSDYLVDAMGLPKDRRTLPYLALIRSKLPDIAIKLKGFDEEGSEDENATCHGILLEKLANPCLLELIWSYWHEEGMLVQTANAISWRFQNRRSASPRDPLANLELDPLRPLNNLLWGYIQDEQHRLTVARRNYEYDHHYGLRLEGQAVQQFRPADTRSKLLEAFHHLLRLCTVFYKQDDDTTVKADAFPVLNALKETHLILSQGAHNQFGDLPATARSEMLMQEWLLARPEFREALPTRTMVAYPEPWMDRVDAMKRLQGWTDTSVLHFRNLGIFGEQIMLAIRWGHWSDVQEPLQAFNLARFFRPQVQGYIHAYRAVTGVDLAAETVDAQVDATLPSVLLKKRLMLQQRAS